MIETQTTPLKRAGPFSFFEFLMAARYLRSKKGEGYISFITWTSFLSITIGVAILIIVMSVMNGFRQELLKKMMGVNGHIVVYAPEGQPMAHFNKIAEKIKKVPEVVLAFPYIEAQVLLATEKMSIGAVVRALQKKDFIDYFNYSRIELPGQTLDQISAGMSSEGKPKIVFGDKKDLMAGIVIGEGIAYTLSLKHNDYITLIYPHGAVTPFGMAPRLKKFPVSGIFKIGMSEYDRSFSFINYQDAQSLFNMKDHANAIEVFIKNIDDTARLAEEIQKVLPPHFQVFTWQMINKTFFEAVEVERNVMLLILSLILIIASFNIISGLVMLVKDKTSNIAILRTMGATKGSIARIFFMMGGAIGFTGTFLGTIIGLLFCVNIETLRVFFSKLVGVELFSPEVYFLSRMPAEVRLFDVGGIVLLSLAFSFVATIYPSWKAASMEPTEALRYD